MKKDIDLLSGYNEAKEKKSSSNSSLLVVVGVLLIIGVMVFMFVSGKMALTEIQEQIDATQNQINGIGNIEALKTKIEQDKTRYTKLINEGMKAVLSGTAGVQTAEISSDIIDIIYVNYAEVPDAEGNARVKIEGLNVNGSNVAFSCATRTYQDAWDFVNYMRGEELPPLSEDATPEEKAEYDKQVKLREKNKRCLSNVIESYPGLPQEGNGEDYSISFGLNIEINWAEMAKEITDDETN